MQQTIIAFHFDAPTVDLILTGLGRLPHDQVRGTIDQIRAHAEKSIGEYAIAQAKEREEALRAKWEEERATPPAPAPEVQPAEPVAQFTIREQGEPLQDQTKQ